MSLLTLLLALLPQTFGAAGSLEVLERIERLRSTGKVLMIAAHPDDENTALLAYCARGRKLQTAYLSLTRGEGGQNLIGSEQGLMLGVIRTEELLAARRLDGARQYFTRAIDFGFSKTAEETMRIWGKEEVLGDIVWTIRKFRPDVVILRFSGTPRDGHGHHQASAMLGKEAVQAAADPARFPEQLKDVQPWRVRRTMWNGFSFNRAQEQEMAKTPQGVPVELGAFDPVLGMSYGELASLSRSQHRSQGFGSGPRRGSQVNWLFTIGGDTAQTDFMDGVDTTWVRFEGGAAVAAALDEALAAFQPKAPERSLPGLLKARRAMADLSTREAKERMAELDETIAAAAGLHFEASTSEKWAPLLGSIEVSVTAIARGKVKVEVVHVVANNAHFDGGGLGTNTVWTRKQMVMPYADRYLSRPYWRPVTDTPGRYLVQGLSLLGEPVDPPAIRACGRFLIDGVEIDLWREVEYVRVDRAKGEVREPLEVMPPVSVELNSVPILFLDGRPKEISVEVVGLSGVKTGSVSLEPSHPVRFDVTPWTQAYTLPESGRVTLKFQLTPKDQPGSGEIRAVAHLASGEYSSRVVRLAYDHITPRTVLAPATARVIRQDIKVLSKRIGYVMGAGDEVPQALEQLGCEVTLLDKDAMEKDDLSRFDAIVTGVRAFNVREDLRRASGRLWEYARQGGTVVVQYNVM
ncbi:MAG TPA: PIG-L family deacetylase, partial [Bryobacteraceae bacterium]|nr:PIG-L family deacetylase [Bryobacteraceae bacterium]